MVNKKILFKDINVEYKNNKIKIILLTIIFSIFISLYLYFSLMNTNLKNSINNYYKKSNIYDIKISGDIPFYKTDTFLIKELDFIKGAKINKFLNAKTTINENILDVKIYDINNNEQNISNDDYINKLSLISGKYPTTVNEGIVTETFLNENNLILGDLIKLDLKDSKLLRAKKIKIVGVIKNEIQNKNEIYINEKNFSYDYYNKMYVTINNKNSKDNINKIKEKLSSIYEERKNLLKNDNEIKINEIKNSLNNLYTLFLPEESLNEYISSYTKELELLEKNQNNLVNSSLDITYREKNNIITKSNLLKNDFNIKIVFLVLAVIIYFLFIYKLINKNKKEILFLKKLGFNNFVILFKCLYITTLFLIKSLLLSFFINTIFHFITWFYVKKNFGISYVINLFDKNIIFNFILPLILIIYFIISIMINRHIYNFNMSYKIKKLIKCVKLCKIKKKKS